MKKALLLLFLFLSQQANAAGTAQLMAVKSTLASVSRAINASINQSEILFEQNGGGALPSRISMINQDGDIFIKTLIINLDYSVGIQLSGEFGTTLSKSNNIYNYEYSQNGTRTASSSFIPTAQSLLGAKILFIPIFQKGDSVITTWECITNADKNAKVFLGANVAATLNNISFISTDGNPGTSLYLSNCIYVPDNALQAFAWP